MTFLGNRRRVLLWEITRLWKLHSFHYLYGHVVLLTAVPSTLKRDSSTVMLVIKVFVLVFIHIVC